MRESMMTSSNGNIFRVTGHLCGEFTGHRWMTRSFDVFFDLRLNKRLNKQSWGCWFETPSPPLWRHCNVLFFSWKCISTTCDISMSENVRTCTGVHRNPTALNVIFSGFNSPIPRYIFPGGRNMKTSQIHMVLHTSARVWGQHWHT